MANTSVFYALVFIYQRCSVSLLFYVLRLGLGSTFDDRVPGFPRVYRGVLIPTASSIIVTTLPTQHHCGQVESARAIWRHATRCSVEAPVDPE
jgi:hypothetical protein